MHSGNRVPGRFRQLYNFKDEKSAGRSYVLIHLVLEGIISNLVSGLFYTSFLVMNGINLVNVGIMTFVPYIANAFQIFSPWLLSYFQKRRWLLVGMRGAYYLLNILGITLLPNVVTDPDIRLLWFVVIVLAANIINALSVSGYSTWHANFLPDDRQRADYFSLQSTVSTLVGQLVAIAVAIVADRLTGTDFERTVIIGIRYLALAIALADLFFLIKPKEYAYPRSAVKLNLLDVFRIPLGHKKFAATMLVCFVHTFVGNLPNGVFNYFLLNDVGVTYFSVYFVNLFYVLFLIYAIRPWKRMLNRVGWFKTFAFCDTMLVPATIAQALLTPGNQIWLYPLYRMWQHYFGVGHATAYSNFLYMNLPEADRDNYITFHNLGTQVFAGLGVLAGTMIVSWIGEGTWTVWGHTLTAVPILMLIFAVVRLLQDYFIYKMVPAMTPDQDQ